MPSKKKSSVETESHKTALKSETKQDSKTMQYAAIACGGCVILLIIAMIVGYFLLKDRFKNAFDAFEDTSQTVNMNTNISSSTGTNMNQSSNTNVSTNVNTSTNTNGGSLKDINLNIGTDSSSESDSTETTLSEPTEINEVLLGDFFIDPTETLVSWVKFDSDQDGVEEACVLTRMDGDLYRAFIINWDNNAGAYNTVYEGAFPAPMDSVMIKDWNGDGRDDFVLVVVPNSGNAIGLIYIPDSDMYIEYVSDIGV